VKTKLFHIQTSSPRTYTDS